LKIFSFPFLKGNLQDNLETMASGATYVPDLGIGGTPKKELESWKITTGDFRAELFFVAAGAYAADAVHSPDAPAIAAPNSYWGVSGGAAVTSGYARCTWVKIGRIVKVDCLIIIDRSLADPLVLDAAEARIRPYVSPTASTEPIKWLGGLPLPEATGTAGGAGLPIFPMTMTLQTDAPSFPLVIGTELGAKLLQDGKMALVTKTDQAAAAPVVAAISDAMIVSAGAFAAGAGTSQKIRIIGQYVSHTEPGRR
jgi:hypothetical protein